MNSMKGAAPATVQVPAGGACDKVVVADGNPISRLSPHDVPVPDAGLNLAAGTPGSHWVPIDVLQPRTSGSFPSRPVQP
jgi:hypothetical protein